MPDTMRKVIGHIALGKLEYEHPYMIEKEVKRVGILSFQVIEVYVVV